MQTIFKYELNVTDIQDIPLPRSAKILCAQTQNDVLCLWVLLEPSEPHESRMIEIFGTGHPMSEMHGYVRRYISTVQMQGGALVFHVFERLRVNLN